MNKETRTFLWGIGMVVYGFQSSVEIAEKIEGGAEWYYWIYLVINIGLFVLGINKVYKTID